MPPKILCQVELFLYLPEYDCEIIQNGVSRDNSLVDLAGNNPTQTSWADARPYNFLNSVTVLTLG